MSAREEVSPVEPSSDDLIAAEIEQAEADTRALFLQQQRAALPDYLDLDDDGNIIPAEGYQTCPACRGATVIPIGFPLSPKLMPCPHCDGWGSVSTGSRLKETANIACESCSGNGYVDREAWLLQHPDDREAYGGS